MTVGPQHENEIARIVKILENMPGCIVLTNDSGSYGANGYRFPRTFNGVNPEGVEYIADVYAVLPDNRRVIFEIDGKVGHPEFKNLRRDSFFLTCLNPHSTSFIRSASVNFSLNTSPV